MATILFWLGLGGISCDSAAWERMVARAQARSKFPGNMVIGPGYALFAARSRAAEPAPLIPPEPENGVADYLLLDRAVGPADSPDRALDQWTDDRLMDGTPTVALRWNPVSRTMTLYRDIMGQRKLVYARVPGAILVASGEDILRAHPDVAGDLDECYLAAYFAALPPAPSETAFRDIHAVGAGETIEFRANGSQRSHVRRLSPDHSWKGMRDQAIVERFGELLANSVRNSCLGATRVGISLSAGLDSSSIAAVASRLAPAQTGGVFAVTHRLSDHPDIDESGMTRALVELLQIDHKAIAVDHLYPGCDPALRPVCPDTPLQLPYREWYEAGYQEFEKAGVDIWLSGTFGDHLFSGAVEWLCDALRFRRFWLLRTQLLGEFTLRGWRGALGNVAIRRPASRLLGRVSAHSDRMNWLRPDVRTRIRERLDEEILHHRSFPRPSQCALVLSAAASADASGEQWFAQRHGLEHRLPFRDPELTRWCLSLPSDFSYRNGQMKWLLRQAMLGQLPEVIRLRPKGSSLTPVFHRGMASANAALAAALETGASAAQAFLDDARLAGQDPDTTLLIKWQWSSFGLWKNLAGSPSCQPGVGLQRIQSLRTLADNTAVDHIMQELSRSNGEGDPQSRMPYQSPVLRGLGDLRELTLGSSIGTQDSGGLTGFSNP